MMDEKIRQKVLEKNDKLINMVIERAKRDFPEDIAIIGLTGSFRTQDFHEKSDLDLIIINNTDRGWDISYCFILGDVGYDIYCTPWETRIQEQSELKSPMVSCLLDLKILYCAKPEYLRRLEACQKRALETLSKPIGEDCIARGSNSIALAKQSYADMMLSSQTGTVRRASGETLYHLVNALFSLNNTYIKRGVKRYPEELNALTYLPPHFMEGYNAVLSAKTIEEMRAAVQNILSGVTELRDSMAQRFGKRPVPSPENLKGTYEELWCNYRNKVQKSVASGDKSYVFHTAVGAQQYLDEMTENLGTPTFDLMRSYNPDNLPEFQAAFERAMDSYALEYDKVGLRVARYDTFEQLYDDYINKTRK